MILDIKADLHYDVPNATDLLLQIEAAGLPDQKFIQQNLDPGNTAHIVRVDAENLIGERIWLRPEGDFICRYRARLDIDRPDTDLNTLAALPPHSLPGHAVRYLMPSRYCPSDEFQDFVAVQFGMLWGGTRVAAIADWVKNNIQYVPGSSHAATTARDTFAQQQGVCRDFAHVMICLLRASAIPARFVSVYAPDVDPQDFHAVVEVFLEGGWHLVDPTRMAAVNSIARIGVGSDAAETSFLTSYAPINFVSQTVEVTVVPASSAPR